MLDNNNTLSEESGEHFANKDTMPEWERKKLISQGFRKLYLPMLQRKRAEGKEYNIFIDKIEFKTVEAKTVTMAMEAEDAENACKIVQAHCRVKDIIPREELEYVEPEPDSDIADKDETSEDKGEEKPPKEDNADSS